MAYRMNQKVHIKAINSIDGIPQMGVIVGIIKKPNVYYLGYMSFRQYLANLTSMQYTVAYERKVGGKFQVITEQYYGDDLAKWENK